MSKSDYALAQTIGLRMVNVVDALYRERGHKPDADVICKVVKGIQRKLKTPEGRAEFKRRAEEYKTESC